MDDIQLCDVSWMRLAYAVVVKVNLEVILRNIKLESQLFENTFVSLRHIEMISCLTSGMQFHFFGVVTKENLAQDFQPLPMYNLNHSMDRSKLISLELLSMVCKEKSDIFFNVSNLIPREY